MIDDHEFQDRDDDLTVCNICGGAEGSLPTSCPGESMDYMRKYYITFGKIDFVNDDWVGEQKILDYYATLKLRSLEGFGK